MLRRNGCMLYWGDVTMRGKNGLLRGVVERLVCSRVVRRFINKILVTCIDGRAPDRAIYWCARAPSPLATIDREPLTVALTILVCKNCRSFDAAFRVNRNTITVPVEMFDIHSWPLPNCDLSSSLIVFNQLWLFWFHWNNQHYKLISIYFSLLRISIAVFLRHVIWVLNYFPEGIA